MVGQHRTTQLYSDEVIDLEEAKLWQRLREIAVDHIRWGRRMCYCLLRREGWTVNYKRVHGYGGRKACSGLLPGSEIGHGPPTDR